MKLYHIIILTFFVFIISCDENIPDIKIGDTADMEIIFKLTYGGKPFVFGEEYQYVGRPIVFSDFSFFISNMMLAKQKNGNTQKIEVSEINFFNFDGTSNISVLLNKVPVGEYDGFTMNLGVPADINRNSPSDFGGDHPLSDTSMYKLEWESYVFTKLVGNYDSEKKDGWDVDFNYLIGKDAAFQSYSITKEIPVIINQTNVLEFEIEIQKLFGNDSSDLINIVDNPTTLGDNGTELMTRIMQNFSSKAIICL